MKKLDLTGQRYGRLLVVEFAYKTDRGQAVWKCLCDCGAYKDIRLSSLRGEESLSCGCRKKEPNLANTTHGLSTSPEYRAWTNMKARCCDSGHQSFHNYGGRGITVCNRWMLSFADFYLDMGPRPEGLTLERRNNEGNYEPSNCYWATRSEQNSNKRNGKDE